MTLIYPVDIDEAIKRIDDAGGNVSRKTHVIYARSTVTFTDDRYPLEVIVADELLPEGTDLIVAERQGERES